MRMLLALLLTSTVAYGQVTVPTQKSMADVLVEKLAPADDQPKTRSMGSRNIVVKPKSVDLVIQFDLDSSKLRNESRPLLDDLVSAMKNERLANLKFKVEGHTDNVPFTGNAVLLDNWDLSVKRSTAIIRVLTKELKVNPAQLIAAGRADYIPLVENNTADNRAKNRRTRIVVLPKIDEFYDMIEKEMKKPTK